MEPKGRVIYMSRMAVATMSDTPEKYAHTCDGLAKRKLLVTLRTVWVTFVVFVMICFPVWQC